VNRFGAFRVLVAGLASATAGLLVFSSVGPDTAFFPTIFIACFLLGLGIGNAFMPLLTIAMAEVPPADAGLGSGITNVSQQVSGAFGLAVLGTVATNHTKALVASHHGLTSSLISGYHIAFLAAAGASVTGILLAFALLRPSRPPLAEVPVQDVESEPPFAVELERQAA
jgi:MFS family permease